MYEINLKVTENGVVKSIVDTNSDGNGKFLTKTYIYLLQTNNEKEKFLKDICLDLGMSSSGIEQVLESLPSPKKHEKKKTNLWKKIKQVFL